MENKQKSSDKAHSEPYCKTNVISRFSVGDKVKYVKKREFYCSTRLGSKGVIQKSANSILGVCHWIKFKSNETWLYDDQIEFY